MAFDSLGGGVGAGDSNAEAMRRAMRETLEAGGHIESVKAQLRARILHALHGAPTSGADGMAGPGATVPTPETVLVHELIREYLAFAGYDNTLAVLQAEAGLPASHLPHGVLATELGLPGAPKSVPVLYALVGEGLHVHKQAQQQHHLR